VGQSRLVLAGYVYMYLIDRAASDECTVVAHHSPSLDLALLDKLLLPTPELQQVVSVVRLHFVKRNSSSRHTAHSLELLHAAADSRYAEANRLQADVMAWEENQIAAKKAEIKELHRRQAELRETLRRDHPDHTLTKIWDRKRRTHRDSDKLKFCRRCQLKKELDSLKAAPFFKVLPKAREEAWMVIGDIFLSSSARVWRDVSTI
jgi:hypothetical protein